MRYASFAFAVLASLVATLAPSVASAQRIESASLLAPFSSARPGTVLPPGWELFRLAPNKSLTLYRFVEDMGVVVLHAHAEAAASGIVAPVRFDINATPILQWRWKVAQLIEDADNAVASREDSPVRIILNFDGDRARLSLRDRASSAIAKRISGRDLPYAELMYIWSNRAPVGTVIENPHTHRIEMVVATTGAAQVGQWVTVRRNVVDDFRRAFNELPGLVTEVGVLTDTDNTGATVDAWYGDIRFLAAP
ncbi:MAG: DUF3047 domain-containing protein [Casimicrobiaceae bacterium]